MKLLGLKFTGNHLSKFDFKKLNGIGKFFLYYSNMQKRINMYLLHANKQVYAKRSKNAFIKKILKNKKN